MIPFLFTDLWYHVNAKNGGTKYEVITSRKYKQAAKREFQDAGAAGGSSGGVTFASVSKWERGAATPELPLIAEMADLLEVSMDARIGNEFRNNDRENVIAGLMQYSHNRSRQSEKRQTEAGNGCQRPGRCGRYYSAARNIFGWCVSCFGRLVHHSGHPDCIY